MTEELHTALLLMGVGMSTVFIVLFCVVIIGKLLIFFVNRFVPVNETADQPPAPTSKIAPSQIAAITSAVGIFTKGKGKATNITKMN